MIKKFYHHIDECLKGYKFKKFVKGDFVSHRRLENNGVMLINQGLYEYGYFNACFVQNMLSSSIFALMHGYVPHISLSGRKEGWTNWETFFEQPFGTKESDVNTICPVRQGLFSYSFGLPYNEEEIRIWGKVYNGLCRFNDKTRIYIESEQRQLMNPGWRVLGVICRGTDYVKLKPKGHPVQPELPDVIAEAKTFLTKYKCQHVYLATEEKKIVDKFEEAFPGKIIVNKRQYYDVVYDKSDMKYIYEVGFDRENDIYLKGLEYLSSLYILSKCNVLVGGNCGGSLLALLMNNMKYEHCHIFDLGLYQ